MSGLVSGVMCSREVRHGRRWGSVDISDGLLPLFGGFENFSRQSGATLLQMVVTTTIIGLVLAAASPNIASLLSAYPVRSGAREVYAQLENARMAAVTYNTSCTFTVSSTTTYTVSPASCSANHIATAVTLDASSKGVAMSGGPSIIFTSKGNASTSGTLTLTDSRGSTMSVAVGTAGRIHIQ
jgi:Tfp pilus assembly protein FimT